MLNPGAILAPHTANVPHTSAAPDTPPASPPPRAAARFQDASGDRPLAGYTLKRGVGQGGFGEIYYATNDAGKDVALKLIRRNLEVELRGIRQCLNLRHPNLIDLYDIRQDDCGDTWVVMEYVADQNLEDVLAARPNGFSPQEALSWIYGIGAGVAYLHERGIVHRDLKPGNIFCDEGIVKLGDYGLSKFISCSRRSGQTESIGTVHYMAPEVANGRYGKEIDVYALGVILYELLTGRVPFEGESVGEVLMKHLTAKPDVSILSEPYRGVVAKALEKDPALRYRSAAEMLAALPPPDGQQSGSVNNVNIPTGANSRRPTASGPSDVESVPQDSAGRCPPAIAIAVDVPATGETVVAAQVVREEPILHAVRQGVQSLRGSLSDVGGRAVKLLLLGAVLLLLISMWPILLGAAIVLGILYFPYWLVWTLAVGRAVPQPTTPTAPSAQQQYVPLKPHETPAPALKPVRRRVAELLGSLLASVLVAAVACTVVALFEPPLGPTGLAQPERFAWLLLVSVAGAWAVLIPAKLWEGRRGDPLVRRLVSMVIGMGLGAVAYALGQFLMVGLPPMSGFPTSPQYRLPSTFYALDGRPLLIAHVACFGALFFLVRWWLQTEPLRSRPVRLRSLLFSIFMAAAVAWLWQFPQPWLPMIAGIMSLSVQLASPWAYAAGRVRRS